MDDLVTTQWLAQHLGEDGLVVVDSTFFLPADGRDARAEHEAAHIPGARFLDIDELVDRTDPAPHMLPPAGEFGAAMRDLGVGRDDRIVVYDNSPYRSAARGWFMLRHFGAGQVAILDGGLQKWKAEGRPLESGPVIADPARFDPAERPGAIATRDQLLKGVGTPIVDARGAARFEGRDPEPRPGVTPGHIPGARNLPFAQLYREDGTFKRGDELAAAFAAAGVDPARPFVATCGSGITANSLIFAARLLGNRDTRLYDGSWAEWGSDPATPKAQGTA